jgi:DNA-binding PadR family transcriptional regulator
MNDESRGRGRGRGRGMGLGPDGGLRRGDLRRDVRRMRRGDIRTAILAVLVERPGHGYEIIQAVEERSGGSWRPSAGSIYPTLQLLEDEGLVTSTEHEGKRVFEVTEAGRAETTRRLEEAGGPPWSDLQTGGGWKAHIGQLAMAARQIQMAGTPAQVKEAERILNEARKQLYRLLAED